MSTEIDADVNAATGWICLVDDLIVRDLKTGDQPKISGMHGDTGKRAVVAGTCLDGIVLDEDIPSTKAHHPDVGGVHNEIVRQLVSGTDERDTI